MRRVLGAVICGVSVFALAACGGDDDEPASQDSDVESTAESSDTSSDDTSSDDTSSDVTLPGDVTLPEGVTIPNVSEDCLAAYQQFSIVIAGAAGGDQETIEQIPDAIDNVQEVLPDDLSDEIEIVAEGYAAYAAVLAEYDYDVTEAFSDPDAVAKLAVISTPEFTAASEAVSGWFEENCSAE